MTYLMVGKHDIRNNWWEVSAHETSVSHRTWKYYVKKLADNFTSSMLGTGCYPTGLIPFWCPFEFLKDK